MYFMLGLPLPDIDSHNGSAQGRAPHEYKDIPIFTEYHTSSGSEEEDPIDEQIRRSPINLSPAIQTISTASCPITTENTITNMSITTAITTQYNPVPLLEEQVHQEEVPQAEEGVHPVEEEAHQEVEEVQEETLHNQLLVTENPWAHCPPYLKGIAPKLRAFCKSSPPTYLLTTMSQLLPHSSKESPSPSLASKDQRSTDGPSSSSNG